MGQLKEHRSILDSPVASAMILVISLIAVTAVWYYLPNYLAQTVEGVNSFKTRGQYGDSYGAVNALFTGLAFAGLIFTILLQHREIRLQRLDFSEQLREMQLSRSEVERQSLLQARQIYLSEVEVTMKPLAVQIELIKLKGLQYNEAARYDRLRADFEAVKVDMEAIIGTLNTNEVRDDA